MPFLFKTRSIQCDSMKKYILLILIFTSPLVVQAQPRDLNGLVNLIIRILNPVFVFLIGAILLFVLWGLASAVFALGGEEGVKKGKTMMLWGTIALFLSVSFWGIVSLLTNTFL